MVIQSFISRELYFGVFQPFLLVDRACEFNCENANGNGVFIFSLLLRQAKRAIGVSADLDSHSHLIPGFHRYCRKLRKI